MSNYSRHITKDLARELLSFGMPLRKYEIGSYDGSLCFDTLDSDHPDWADCDRYRLPTYGEVIDWFSSRGIHITFETFFTFALRDRVAYFWKISYIDDSCGDLRLTTISEESESIWKANEAFGGSFDLDAKAAIRYAMTRFPMQS